MPRLHGMTLHRWRRRLGHAPDAARMGSLVDAVLQALDVLHGAGVLHRDVAPDNILLPLEGPAVLLDMGAAHDCGETPTHGQSPRIGAVKRGYAPPEQYRSEAAAPQGPWTDLYALGAVLHYLFRGQPPASPREGGFDRSVERPPETLDRQAAEIWMLMAWMLELQPERRPQSVADLRRRSCLLAGGVPALAT